MFVTSTWLAGQSITQGCVSQEVVRCICEVEFVKVFGRAFLLVGFRPSRSWLRPFRRPKNASPPLTLTRVASGLSRSIYATAAPGDPSKLFVVEQGGKIKIIENGSVLATPFLDISSIVGSSSSEQGLLGLTFDPNYQSNRKFYVNYTDPSGNTNIASYQVSASNPRVANTTQTPILSIAQPYANHNGGWLGFGPDQQPLYRHGRWWRRERSRQSRAKS